jgi:hypothetical protein
VRVWPAGDGSSSQVAGHVWFPNGMIVLGEYTLVVAESHADRLTVWTITDSGELVDQRVWADLGPGFGSGRHLRGRRRSDPVRQRCRTPTTATAAPRTVSSWSTRSPYGTPGDPDKPRHRPGATAPERRSTTATGSRRERG